MKPLVKLAIVASLHLAVLVSILGFKAYTAHTAETIVLRTMVTRPGGLLRSGGGAAVPGVVYEITTADRDHVSWDSSAYGTVYVELAKDEDGRWAAVAVHDGRTRDFGGTSLIKGEEQYDHDPRVINGAIASGWALRYGIERVYMPDSAAGSLPGGDRHDIAVEVRLDRFGNATPKRFIIDGEPYPLRRW